MTRAGEPAVTLPMNLSRSNAKRHIKKNLFNLMSAAIFSLIVGFGLGNIACASSWLSKAQVKHSSSFAPGEEEAIHVDHSDNRKAQQSSPRGQIIRENDRRSIQRASIPYKCGVVFFYHIPSTGGSSINNWFRKYMSNISYYERWTQSVRKDGSFHPDPEQIERRFRRGMTEHIQNLGPHEWRIAHSHSLSTYLNESEKFLYKWRSDVEAQGCQLINAVMLRDPLNHAMSLWKIVDHKNSSTKEWLEYLESPTGTGKWGTVLDFFLYNIHGLRYHDDYPHGPGGRNPFNVTKEVKVKRALDLLHRHFDIVSIDHATFLDKLLSLTGWPYVKMLNRNRYLKELNFRKDTIESLQKLLFSNGDLDFIDRVKYEYHDYLAYLDN